MTSEALYERYKDALKRGHVASLRGRVDEALLAYAEAASIAPERSTPHSSAGTALLRRKRPADALRHYEVALSIAPRDESALLGRAHALAALDRRGDAADAFDTLAEVQAGTGRLADAVDAARRGLEMAEGRERRRTLERLIARLRANEPDEPGRLALERALQVLEGPAVPRARHAHRAASGGARDQASTAGMVAEETRQGGHPEAPGVPLGHGGAEVGASATQEGEPAPALAPGGAPDASSADAAEVPVPSLADASAAEALSEARAVSAAEAAAVAHRGRLVPGDAAITELAARAEAAADAGTPGRAVEAMLDLAALHVRDGRIDAALDACYAALSFDPDHVALHLALVELYGLRGWDSLATDKLGLLERLARLDGDDAALAAVAVARSGRG
jgi:tetratricopeptide (TPR) repeat protein